MSFTSVHGSHASDGIGRTSRCPSKSPSLRSRSRSRSVHSVHSVHSQQSNIAHSAKDDDDTKAKETASSQVIIPPFDPCFEGLPAEMQVKIAAHLSHDELVVFADTNKFNHNVARTVLRRADALKTVVVYAIADQSLSVCGEGAKWTARAQPDAHPVAAHLIDANDKRSLAFSQFVALLGTRLVKQVEIDMNNCDVDTILRFFEVLRKSFVNHGGKVFDCVVFKAESTNRVASCVETAKWTRIVECASEVLWTRRLVLMLACGNCAYDGLQCPLLGNLVYTSWKRRDVLECVVGPLISKYDMFDGSFPRLRGFVDHSTHSTAAGDAHLTALGDVQMLLREWRKGELPYVLYMTSIDLPFVTIQSDTRFIRFVNYLDKFEKSTKFWGSWSDVNEDVRYRIPRASDEREMVVVLKERVNRLIIECFAQDHTALCCHVWNV